MGANFWTYSLRARIVERIYFLSILYPFYGILSYREIHQIFYAIPHN
jgi:hypothetical protein